MMTMTTDQFSGGPEISGGVGNQKLGASGFGVGDAQAAATKLEAIMNLLIVCHAQMNRLEESLRQVLEPAPPNSEQPTKQETAMPLDAIAHSAAALDRRMTELLDRVRWPL